MPKKERPLPKPPGGGPFSRKKRFGQEEPDGGLMADELTMAMASGNLDGFLQERFKDNEQGKKLAMMMMGMSGMTPDMAPAMAPAASAAPSGEPDGSAEVPEDIKKAVVDGDIKGLAGMLKREFHNRSGEEVPETQEHATSEKKESATSEKKGSATSEKKGSATSEKKGSATSEKKGSATSEKVSAILKEEGLAPPEKGSAPSEQESHMEKDVINALMLIARENDVSIDWVMARALKLYVRDHRTTGRI